MATININNHNNMRTLSQVFEYGVNSKWTLQVLVVHGLCRVTKHPYKLGHKHCWRMHCMLNTDLYNYYAYNYILGVVQMKHRTKWSNRLSFHTNRLVYNGHFMKTVQQVMQNCYVAIYLFRLPFSAVLI